ncbi:MAG TPA: hypothetical protein PKA00_19810 [Saprospiraceae bacterium]|nr:hypothetical protein [Saprospiraceae bacterium]
MIKKILILVIIGLLTGCSRSLVYSPSINLSNKPLKEKEIDFQGGVELLPETRPEELQGNQTTLGLSGQLSYGFSDKFNLTIKGWADIEGRESLIRSGYSLNGQLIKILSERDRVIIIPRTGIALNGNEITGYGLGTSVIYQNTINQKLSWYGGAGLLWGFRYLEKETNKDNEEKIPMGFGIVGNLGLGWQLSNDLRINCELNPVYQINTFDNNSQILLAPTIGIGYTINRKVD